MQNTTSVQAFFSEEANHGGIIVHETPKLDLDLYISNYTGRTRLDRLILIGRTSVTLCVEALKAAVAEAKKGRDEAIYKQAVEYLFAVAPTEPEAILDTKWLDATAKRNKATHHELETCLRQYKNNLVKDSIRMGHEDLAKFYEATGDLTQAYESYARMRPDASTQAQIAEVGKHVIRVAIHRKDWANVLANAGKLNIAPIPPNEEKSPLLSYVPIVQGLGFLGFSKYEESAACFLRSTYPTNGKFEFNDIVSPHDVAIYGCLLALATMDRDALQTLVLNNSQFRPFLDQEPLIRKAVSHFVNSRYSNCLAVLETYRSDCLLDIILQRHVAKIYSSIRTKCIVAFFAPYSSITIESLDKAFATADGSVISELETMILNGSLKARLDLVNKVVNAYQPDPRITMQKTALVAAAEYERLAISRLERINIIAAGLELKSGISDGWNSGSNEPSVAFRHATAVGDGNGDEQPVSQGYD